MTTAALDHVVRILDSNLFALAGSIAMLLAYHLYLQAQLRSNPRYTIQAINNTARTAWVVSVMASGNKDVLAVQTLRNSTMAATFLASTAILLIIGVLNLSQTGGGLLRAVDARDAAPLYLLKLTPLLLDLFGAFFFFSFAIRMYNHVGYLINSGGQPGSPATPHYVARLLNRGGAYYTLGMRAYYLSVPFVFWLLGSLYLLAATCVVIAVLYHVDRSPGDAPTAEEQAEAGRAGKAAPAGQASRLGFLGRKAA